MHIDHHYKGLPNNLGANLAIFFDRKKGGNRTNDFLESLRFWQTDTGVDTIIDNVNLSYFLSKIDFSRYFLYYGSLTEPPC